MIETSDTFIEYELTKLTLDPASWYTFMLAPGARVIRDSRREHQLKAFTTEEELNSVQVILGVSAICRGCYAFEPCQPKYSRPVLPSDVHTLTIDGDKANTQVCRLRNAHLAVKNRQLHPQTANPQP